MTWKPTRAQLRFALALRGPRAAAERLVQAQERSGGDQNALSPHGRSTGRSGRSKRGKGRLETGDLYMGVAQHSDSKQGPGCGSTFKS